MFEFVLVGRSRSQYDAQSEADQGDIDRAIRLLELDPWPDDVTKASVVVPPLVLSAMDDGRWRIIYRVVDYRFIEIFAITRSA